jgi:hypothetical protein
MELRASNLDQCQSQTGAFFSKADRAGLASSYLDVVKQLFDGVWQMGFDDDKPEPGYPLGTIRE